MVNNRLTVAPGKQHEGRSAAAALQATTDGERWRKHTTGKRRKSESRKRGEDIRQQ